MIIDKKIKYFNLLYVISYSIFMLVIFIYFKTSIHTDGYFVALSIIKFLFLVTSMTSDMFVQFYIRIKKISNRILDNFVFTNILISFIYGILVFFLSLILLDELIPFFSHKKELTDIIKSYSNVMLLNVLIYPFFILTSNYFVANNKMLIYYISMSIPAIIDLFVLLIFQDIELLPYSFILGFYVALIYRLKYFNISKYVKFAILRKRKFIILYIKKSVSLKSVNLIPIFVLNILVYSYLSSYEDGLITIYTYCFFISYTIFKIVFEPNLQNNLFLITSKFYNKKYFFIKLYLIKLRYDKTFIYVTFAIIILIGIFLMNLLTELLDSKKVLMILISTLIFQLFVFYEETFNIIFYSTRKIRFYFIKNIIFLISFLVLNNILSYLFIGYYSVLISLLVSQLFAVFFVYYFSKKVINVKYRT